MIAAVIADDFTGANDCAGSFAEHGFSAFSARGEFFPDILPEVYVRSLETRFSTPDEARRASRIAWTSLAERGQGRLINYQRIDSTLRGNAAPEILGLLEATQARRVAFCAAFPVHGRLIQKGVVSVHGLRLDRSEYAFDPLSPSRHFRPQKLFPAGLAAELKSGSVSQLRKAIRASDARVLCFDAASDADLRAIAKACLSEGIRDFSGSSGLSLALAAELRPGGKPARTRLPPKRAVLAGTVSQTTLDQLEIMRKSGLSPWFDLEGRSSHAADFALSSISSRGQIRHLKGIAARRRFADARMSELVTRGLRLAGGAEKRLWLLTGGHCAEIFFNALKLRGSWVRGMLLPGLPLLEAMTLDGKKIWATSKPGGFGKPDLIEKFMRLRSWK